MNVFVFTPHSSAAAAAAAAAAITKNRWNTYSVTNDEQITSMDFYLYRTLIYIYIKSRRGLYVFYMYN
jgi:hypothetical protein